jgi:hypothetical protein
MFYTIDSKFYRIHQLLFIIPRIMCIANRGVYVTQWLMSFTSNNKPLTWIRTWTPIWSAKISRHLSINRGCLVGDKNCLPFAGAWFCPWFLVVSVLVIILVICVVFFVLFVFILCLVCWTLPISLDCLFLIAPSVFSKVYLSGQFVI